MYVGHTNKSIGHWSCQIFPDFRNCRGTTFIRHGPTLLRFFSGTFYFTLLQPHTQDPEDGSAHYCQRVVQDYCQLWVM